jgi:hypothetical protein
VEKRGAVLDVTLFITSLTVSETTVSTLPKVGIELVVPFSITFEDVPEKYHIVSLVFSSRVREIISYRIILLMALDVVSSLVVKTCAEILGET